MGFAPPLPNKASTVPARTFHAVTGALAAVIFIIVAVLGVWFYWFSRRKPPNGSLAKAKPGPPGVNGATNPPQATLANGQGKPIEVDAGQVARELPAGGQAS